MPKPTTCHPLTKITATLALLFAAHSASAATYTYLYGNAGALRVDSSGTVTKGLVGTSKGPSTTSAEGIVLSSSSSAFANIYGAFGTGATPGSSGNVTLGGGKA